MLAIIFFQISFCSIELMNQISFLMLHLLQRHLALRYYLVVVNQKKNEPQPKETDERSLTQKTAVWSISRYVEAAVAAAAHTISTSAAFFMVLLAEKRVRTQVLTVKKAKEVPGICFVLLLPSILKFFYQHVTYIVLATTTIYVQICIKRWCHFFHFKY